jgi:hypothetical protein
MQGPTRFWLERSLGGGHTVVFVMLNPSTADDTNDDPTIRRCIGFATLWGYGRMIVVNTNPMRSTDPRVCPYPDAESMLENDAYLQLAGMQADRIVCAWGNHVHPELRLRTLEVLSVYALYHLGLTKKEEPRHPLYLDAETQPTRWMYECGEGYAHPVGQSCRGQCVLRG